MNRRQFTRHATVAGLVPLIAPYLHQNTSLGPNKARRLQTGDLIGLITPGSYIPDAALEKAVRNLEALGFRVALGNHVRAKRGYTAGTDDQRRSDLHLMFANPEIKAVWCARGGYGCTRLLPHLDFELIRQHPKLLIGYSDVTALLLAIWQKTGLVGLHGPVASSTFTPYTTEQFWAVAVEGRNNHIITLATEYQDQKDPLYQYQTLYPGVARGTLLGGNLTLLAAMAGTPFALDATDKLLFLEDIDEKPYRVDRMLVQLQQSANLSKAKGVAGGIFAGCVAKPGEESLTLGETMTDHFAGGPLPAVYGLSFGHIGHQCTLPLGILAELNTAAQTLTLLESAVV